MSSVTSWGHVAKSSFALRFGYAGWLLHLKRGDAPGFAEIGRKVTRTGQAVSAWAAAAEAPTDYRVHRPLAEFLEVDEAWLVRGEGEPPRAELWTAWIRARSLSSSAIKEPPRSLGRQQAPSSRSKTAAKKDQSA